MLESKHRSDGPTVLTTALNRALEESDTGPMGEIWSHSSDVSAMHPFGGRMVGWEEVGDSWEQAAQAFSGGQVAVDDMVVVPISEDAAYTLGTEHGEARIGSSGPPSRGSRQPSR